VTALLHLDPCLCRVPVHTVPAPGPASGGGPSLGAHSLCPREIHTEVGSANFQSSADLQPRFGPGVRLRARHAPHMHRHGDVGPIGWPREVEKVVGSAPDIAAGPGQVHYIVVRVM